MSPVPPPPPAGTFIPSDDWTEDTSFDLSPTAHQLILPTSPSSSTSSKSHRSQSSLSNVRQHTSSPLRQSYTGIGKNTIKLKKGENLTEELLEDFDDDDNNDFDFDLPNKLQTQSGLESGAKSRPRSSTSSSITRTIIGNGPTGIGTITKLGSTSSSGSTSQPISNIMKGTVKARALALEKSWEADVDFDDNENNDIFDKQVELPSQIKSRSTVRRLTFTPPKKGFMPPADALDELGFDLDGFGEEEEDQATLKAGATIKALLPPPRPRAQGNDNNNNTIKPSKSNSILNTPSTPPNQDLDSIELESDFALPLNLTNLTLATQPQYPSSSRSRSNNKPRISNASTATTTTTTNSESWDSPSNLKKGWGWGSEDSPNNLNSTGNSKRRSETSATSISDALPETPTTDFKLKAKNILIEPENELDDEEDDMEIGIELPSPTFFSNKRSKELNSILDKKRKPQFAPSPNNNKKQSSHQHRSNTDDSLRRGHQQDDSFEDGLVLDEPGVELSKHRLKEKKRARDKYPISTIKRPSGPTITSINRSVSREKGKAWEKQREQGWGRITPLPPTHTNNASGSIRDKSTQSSLGLSFRSNSASATTLLRDTSKRVDSPTSHLTLTGREKESMRSRSGHIHTMLPPPIPSNSTHTATPSSRLRHQKSHFQLGATTPIIPQSPNLTRKQSLASLQDAMIDKDKTFNPLALGVGENPSSRYHNSTSRLTMPTSSSKAKSRPPINSIFPTHTHTPNSSASSSSSFHLLPKLPHPHTHTQENVRRMVDMPKRNKTWGDGSELDSINDLTIDDDHPRSTITGNPSSSIGLGKPSRKGHEPPSSQIQRMAPPAKPTATDTTEKRKKSGSGTTTTKRKNRKPALIKHFGVADKKKVVGEMTWNPTTLRWEGNESVLKDFDTISVSARPALITHYTGSSVGGISSLVGISSGNPTSAPRIVGDMQFDPIQMKWISILSPEDDEPDPFEGMADDEDDEFGGGGGAGGTITRSSGRKLLSIGGSGGVIRGGSITASSNWTSRLTSESSSIASSTNTNLSYSPWENQPQLHLQSIASTAKVPISEELWKECKEAEDRHRKEMKNWISRTSSNSNSVDVVRERERKEEKRLWEIRNLAMKS